MTAKYIEFEKQARPVGRKTDAWVVWPKGERNPNRAIGLVEWFPRWRKYTFWPVANTVFEQTCLRDIAAFIEEETVQHKRAETSATQPREKP